MHLTDMGNRLKMIARLEMDWRDLTLDRGIKENTNDDR
jgi:hypothetical protein